MDKDHKKEVLASLEEMMKLSLYYCRDDDDEIKGVVRRRERKKELERKFRN